MDLTWLLGEFCFFRFELDEVNDLKTWKYGIKLNIQECRIWLFAEMSSTLVAMQFICLKCLWRLFAYQLTLLERREAVVAPF